MIVYASARGLKPSQCSALKLAECKQAFSHGFSSLMLFICAL